MSDLEKKQQIARENGKKSKGPITPEGKKRSSLNGITHGLASKCVVLANESQDAYDQLLAQYQQEWQPVSVTESHLLTQMVNSCWRLRRIWSMETALIDSEMFTQKEDFEAAWSHHHPAMRAMDAMTVVQAESPVMLETLHRYELRYDRLYRSSMDQLIKLRRLRNAPEIAPALPTPAPEPELREIPEAAPPPTPAAWYTRLLAFLLSLLAVLHLRPAARKSRKSSQKTAGQLSEPISLFDSAFWTFECPEFFFWLTSFIPTPARPKHEAPPQSE
jgi:hypothetical protein